MNNLTIYDTVNDGLCTGCGTCVSLCPNESIEMTLDPKKGIFLAEINKDSCNNCGICYKICPGHEVDFTNLNTEIFGQIPEDPSIGNYTNCYFSYSTDDEIRLNSSSGGLITQFLIFALDEKIIDGALVTRMSKENPFMPETFIARTREEIMEASKSKYCPVPANISLKLIMDTPEHEKFAVVGLPCHIHGIRKAGEINKKIRDKIKIHVGIMCGTTKTINATFYQLKRMKISENTVKDIYYRGEGWPGKMKIILKNNHVVLENLINYYDGEFCSFVPLRCASCIDHTCELSDMSFGDAWIDEIKKVDQKGTSIVVSRKKSVDKILRKMQDSNKINLELTDSNNVAISQKYYNFKKNKINVRFKILKLLGKKTPTYNQNPSNDQKNNWSDYVMSIWLFFWIFISSKKYLWKLLSLRSLFARIFS